MKKDRLVILLLFIGIVVLPQIRIQGVVTSIAIIEPDGDSYSYYSTSEVFEIRLYHSGGVSSSITQMKFDAEADYVATSAHGCYLGLTMNNKGAYYEILLTIDPSYFSVGSHTFYFRFVDNPPANWDDSASFSRDAYVPTNYAPSITITNPSLELEEFDFSTGTTYTATADVHDDGDLDKVELYVDDILNKTWDTPNPIGQSFSKDVTLDVSRPYEFKWIATDSEQSTTKIRNVQAMNGDSPDTYIEILEPNSLTHSTNPEWQVTTHDNDTLKEFYYEWENNGYAAPTAIKYDADEVPEDFGFDGDTGDSVAGGILTNDNNRDYYYTSDEIDLTIGITIEFCVKIGTETCEVGVHDGTKGLEIQLYTWDTKQRMKHNFGSGLEGSWYELISSGFDRNAYHNYTLEVWQSGNDVYYDIWIDGTSERTANDNDNFGASSTQVEMGSGSNGNIYWDWYYADFTGHYDDGVAGFDTSSGYGSWDSTCYIYQSDEVNISRTETFTMTFGSSSWSSQSEGAIEIKFTYKDAGDRSYTSNITITKDVTAPSVEIVSPVDERDDYENYLDVPGLLYIPSWGDNENESGNRVEVTLNENRSTYQKWTWSDTSDISTRSDTFPSFDKPIVSTPGNHSLRVKLYDAAGNSGDDLIWFKVVVSKTITFSFTSSYNSASIDAEKYLKIYIDGQGPYASNSIPVEEDVFELEIKDQFDNQLYYSASYDYAATISLSLPMRAITLENSYSYTVGYEIIQDTSPGLLEGSITAGGSTIIYLFDGSYSIIADTYQESTDDDWHYEVTTTAFTSSSESTSVTIVLSLVANPHYQLTVQDAVTKTIQNLLIGFIISFVVIQLADWFFSSRRRDQASLQAQKSQQLIEQLKTKLAQIEANQGAE